MVLQGNNLLENLVFMTVLYTLKLVALTYATTTIQYQHMKDGTTVHVQMPGHSTACKGISTTANNIATCTAKCDGALVSIWNLVGIKRSDGPCEWFAYDTITGACHLCFPYSTTLPVILDFDTSTAMKIFSLVNGTCKIISIPCM